MSTIQVEIVSAEKEIFSGLIFKGIILIYILTTNHRKNLKSPQDAI